MTIVSVSNNCTVSFSNALLLVSARSYCLDLLDLQLLWFIMKVQIIIELILYYFLHTVISVGFEMSSYNVQENAGTVDDLVFVIKLNDMQSERILSVQLDVSVVGTAERGQLPC